MADSVEAVGKKIRVTGDSGEAVGKKILRVTGDSVETVGKKIRVTGDSVETVGKKIRVTGDSGETVGKKIRVTGDSVEGLGRNIRRESDSFYVDKKYFTSKHGLIKEAAMVLAILGFITSFFGHNSSSASVIFFATISILAFWVIAIEFAVTAVAAIPPSNFVFLAVQVLFGGFWTIFLMISSIAIITNGGIYMLPAFLGFGAMFFSSFDAFYLMYTYSQHVGSDGK